MNNLMSGLRRIFTIVLVSALFLIASISNVSAAAEPVTPEAAAYEIDRANSPQEAGKRLRDKASEHRQELRDDTLSTNDAYKNAKNAAEKAPQKAQGVVENIREKLNLNEPVPESTKEFLNNPVESFQEEGQYPQENVDSNPFRGQD